MLQLLEYHNAGAFTQHETVAITVKRTAGVCRIVVPFGKRFHGSERAKANVRERGLAAAGDHHLDLAVANQLIGIAHRVRGAGAGRDHDLIRAVQAVLNGQMRAGRVAD